MSLAWVRHGCEAVEPFLTDLWSLDFEHPVCLPAVLGALSPVVFKLCSVDNVGVFSSKQPPFHIF